MLIDLFLPSESGLELLSATRTPTGVEMDLSTTAEAVACSACHVFARRVHSRYQRTLADLPVTQLPVRLQFHVRRFFCDNPACERRTFSETLPAVVLPFARRTVRLAREQRQLGLELGGEVGARTAQRQGMPVSADTLLRLVRQEPLPDRPPVVHLGVDDFALRKGQVYGTLLVDLDQHRPIDLLPDRSAATLEQWLKDHPGVKIIARDRAGDYAEGAARGAPQAVQVADRFHMVRNTQEMLQRLLERQQAALRAAAQVNPGSPEASSSIRDENKGVAEDSSAPCGGTMNSAASTPSVPPTESRLTTAGRQSQTRRAGRWATYQAVRDLRTAGLSVRAIAARLHLGRTTVRRFAAADEFPERATRRPVESQLDPFVPYLEQQLAAGQDNGMELWRQLRDQQGYRGSRALVSRWVARHRHLVPAADPAVPRPRRRGAPPRPVSARPSAGPRRCSARQAAFLLLREPDDLEEADQLLVERLCSHSPEVQTARHLTHEFTRMVRERHGEGLEGWLSQAEESAIPEVRRFGAGIRRDQAAVLAGLSLPYSSGQVEGQVNRLKFVKRSMYGRGNFDLLRHRVLVA